jgi:hypothetical protein
MSRNHYNNTTPTVCSARFSLVARAEELRELAAAAERANMNSAAYLRYRLRDIFEPAKAGRRWPADPAERHRSNTA